MKITSTVRLEGRGVAFVTDREVPELDWSGHRGTTRVRILVPGGPEGFAVEGVELVLKNRTDYLGFVSRPHAGDDFERFVGYTVELIE